MPTFLELRSSQARHGANSGYIERDFDDELGVNKDYQGQGFTNKLSPALLLNFLRVALKTQKVTKTFSASGAREAARAASNLTS